MKDEELVKSLVIGLFVSILIIFAYMSMEPDKEENHNSQPAKTESVKNKIETSVIRMGECEYIGFIGSGGYFYYTHKGDCSNSIHVYQYGK